MKRTVIFAVVLFTFACAEAPDQKTAVDVPIPPVDEKVVAAPKDDEKTDGPKASCERLPKEWNLKVKSVTMQPGRAWITLEFTKDVDDKELKTVKFAFQNSNYSGPPQRPKDKDKAPKEPEEIPIARIYFFDADNVSIQSHDPHGGIIISNLDGEVTGKTPDAFRIAAPTPGDLSKRVKKIEIRTVKVPKP